MKFATAIVLVGLVGAVALGAPSGNPIQQVCERIVSTIKMSGTVDLLEMSARGFCSMLQDEKSIKECAEQVHKIAQQVRTESPEEFCKQLPDTISKAKKCEKMCEFCKQTVQKIKDAGSLEQNKMNAENWCRILISPAKVQQCKQSVDKFYNTLEHNTAEGACKEFDLCN